MPSSSRRMRTQERSRHAQRAGRGPDQQFVEGDLQGASPGRPQPARESLPVNDLGIDAVFAQRVPRQLLLVARFDGIDVAIEDERVCFHFGEGVANDDRNGRVEHDEPRVRCVRHQ